MKERENYARKTREEDKKIKHRRNENISKKGKYIKEGKI